MKLLILAAVLALPGATPANGPAPAGQNALRELPDCVPIPQQVAGDRRDDHGMRLDRQSPAQLLLAVDRRVNNCPEATIIRRNVGAPGR